MRQTLGILIGLSLVLSGVDNAPTGGASAAGYSPAVPAAMVQSLPAAGHAYSVTDLGTLGGSSSEAYGINDAGHVVGISRPAVGLEGRPFLWKDDNANGVSDPGEMRDLLPPAGFSSGIAFDINSSGQVVGDVTLSSTSSQERRAFVWQEGSGFKTLPTLGAVNSFNEYAYAINQHEQIAGGSIHPQSTRLHGVLGTVDSVVDLGTLHGDVMSLAYDINSSGQVVGFSRDLTGFSRAVLWQDGTAISLDMIGGARFANYGNLARAINDVGQVVGFSPSTAPSGEAFLWQGGATIGLGTLGGTYSEAMDINDSGEVVGWADNPLGFLAPFHWRDKNGNGRSDAGEMVDLNTQIDPALGWELWFANAINNRGQIVGAGFHNGAYRAFLLTPAAKRRPVLIIPGIAGTYAADVSDDEPWIMNRGSHPVDLQIDPLAKVYHDLIKTFENAGYTRDKDLFVVNYDWRLTPGPDDGSIDGTIGGITAQSVSDQTFHYGVDYLGAALRRAYELWERDHPGEKLDEVDIVAHSTGGLVARTYIQSAAYGEAFDGFGAKKLPRVKNLIMVGVPNRGASKAWNPLHDDWDADMAYVAVLSKIINRAYQNVLKGQTITGPPAPINFNSIRDARGNPDPVKFINLYVPTIRALLATYDFLDSGSGYTNVNTDESRRNVWVLDLNAGLDLATPADPSPFASKCKATIIYATSVATTTAVRKRAGPAEDVISPFTRFAAQDTLGEWYEDIIHPASGDGTVPTDSSAGQFIGDSRVTLRPFAQGTNTQGDVSHTGLMFNREVQKLILETVGASFDDEDISTSKHELAAAVLSVPFHPLPSRETWLDWVAFILDPVDGFVVDGAGRRLGYSQATGPLAEIPGSVWFGNDNGIGWVFGPVQEPLTLQLTGRGEHYYVMVSAVTDHGAGGVIDSGTLAQGVSRSLPIPLGGPDEGPDADGDGTSDDADADDDNDGQSDADENLCGSDPFDAQSKSQDGDGDNAPNCVDADDDGDSVDDGADNCPLVANTDQNDRDADAIGDACDQLTYNFTGFFQPVNSLPTVNVVSAGSAVPVKFSLGGNQGLNIFEAGSPLSQQMVCDGSLIESAIEQTVAAGGSSLSYDAATGQYTYVWKTDNGWKGTCRQLLVKLADGGTRAANFRFR